MFILFNVHLFCLFCCIFSTANADNYLSLVEDNIDSISSQSLLQQCRLSSMQELSQMKEGKYLLISNKVKSSGFDLEQFVEQTSRFVSSMTYRVCVLLFFDSSLLSEVTVIRFGNSHPFYGKRDPQTILRFIQELEHRFESNQLFSVINNKMDKKAFENVIVPKVVGYFPDLSDPVFLEFQQAARQLAPQPPFYVVHDSQIAAKFQLSQPGQLCLIRRLEKSRLYFYPSTSEFSQTASTANEIVSWISLNRGLVLHQLQDTNLYDPELMDLSKYQLVAVGDKQSSLGLYFFKILTKTIQNISRENEIRLNNSTAEMSASLNLIRLNDIEVVWIDLQLYPNAGHRLTSKYQVEPTKNTWFVLIHSPSMTGQKWFDFNLLNLTQSDKKSDELNIELVRQWILSVTDRQDQVFNQQNEDRKPVSFLMQPEPVSVRQSGSFVLDCRVQEAYGQCAWSRNNVLIKSIGSVESPYQWVSSEQNGDCSITVTKADVQRDAGQWECMVLHPQTESILIRSKPVPVLIRSQSNEL